MSETNFILVKDLINFMGSDVVQAFGNIENVYVCNLKPSEFVDEKTLDWIDSKKTNKQAIAEGSKAKVVLADSSVTYSSVMRSQSKILLLVVNPKLSLIKIAHRFFVEKVVPGIHPAAFIHPLAKIGANPFIGANCSIGKCVIGDNVIIYPNVVINDNVIIGNNVTIKAGAKLGFDGFGYERDESGSLVKFPQLGKLFIHDQVEIGSNTCIDRGALSDTIIGFNTKINNLCHIAHNVIIGKNVIIAAQVNISGSTTINDDVWVSPCSSFRGHQEIGQGTTIGMGAVVINNVPSGEVWVGNPAHKLTK